MRTAFLDWDGIENALKVVHWNIHGARTKLLNPSVARFLCTFDIIFLSEVQSALPVNLAGYVTHRGHGEDMHRGGCATLIKNKLMQHVAKIESPHHECTLLKMKFLNKVTIASCYVAPTDSNYHTYAPLMEIHDRLMQAPNEDSFIVLGDLNARFGNERLGFINEDNTPLLDRPVSYSPSPDPIAHPNANANYISQTLGQRLVLINGLHHGEKSFPSALTFRQRTRWISELDLALASPQCLKLINDFVVHQRTDLPSDHAPISCEIAIVPSEHQLGRVLERSRHLGQHREDAPPPPRGTDEKCVRRKTIKMTHVDRNKLKDALNMTPPPPMDQIQDQDINALAKNVTDTLYSIARQCQTPLNNPVMQRTNNATPNGTDWRTMIESHDSKELWKAIAWNGEIKSGQDDQTPDDEEFRLHFEELLNPTTERQNLEAIVETEATGIYLPVTDDPIDPREVVEAAQSLKTNKSGGPSGLPQDSSSSYLHHG